MNSPGRCIIPSIVSSTLVLLLHACTSQIPGAGTPKPETETTLLTPVWDVGAAFFAVHGPSLGTDGR